MTDNITVNLFEDSRRIDGTTADNLRRQHRYLIVIHTFGKLTGELLKTSVGKLVESDKLWLVTMDAEQSISSPLTEIDSLVGITDNRLAESIQLVIKR